MKLFHITVNYDDRGNRFPRFDSARVYATNVKSAVAKFLRKKRKGWREAKGSEFSIRVTVLGGTENGKGE